MGAPGAGKSRLALEVVNRLSARFAAGVFVCELASIEDPSLVKTSIAGSLGFAPEIQGDLGELVRRRFAKGSVLLLVDNCEHVRAEAVLAIDVLLAATTGIRVLTTSRERLQTPREMAWTLPPLIPDEALQLIAQRAASLDAAFAIDASNQRDLKEICARVDGLPLALELVAPHLVLLPAVEVVRMLSDSSSLLVGGAGTARHRTMSAALDWSVALLAPRARDDLFRLSVFPSNFRLDAAEAILSVAPSAVLERLGELRDSSLLVADTQGSAARFRLLEPVRQYAIQHLRGKPYEKATRRRHAKYIHTRSTWIGDRLLGTREQSPALAAFEELIADIREATAWSFRHEPALAAQIIGHTGWAWEITGRLREGERLERRGLQVATSSADRARLLTRLGSLRSRRTMARDGTGIGADAIAEARKAGDKHELALALCLSTDEKIPDISSSRLDEAASIAAETGDGLVLAWVPFFRGLLCGLAGDLELARKFFEEATERIRTVGDVWCSTQSIANMVYICLLLGDYSSAREHLRSVLTLLLEHPNWVAVPSVIRHAAQLAAHTGRPAEAMRLVAVNRRLREEMEVVGLETEEVAQVARAQIYSQRRVRQYLDEGERLSTIAALSLALAVVEEPPPLIKRKMQRRDINTGLLTPRELQVVRLIAEGMTNREISMRLFITERGAEGHVERIRNKLGVRSRAQVAIWAQDNGILSGGRANTES